MLTHKRTTPFFFFALIVLIVLDYQVGMHWWFYIVLVFVHLTFVTLGTFIISLQFFTPTVCKGESWDSIALTFDDGPIEGYTDRILEILKERNTEAAFFCIGNKVDESPELARRIINEGHIIGNHSYWHKSTFDFQSQEKMERELTMTDEVVKNVVGRKPVFFRPPYGVTNPNLAKAIRQNGYTTIGWSLRSFDTIINDAGKLSRRVKSKIKGGDIVLFHDYSDEMIQILPEFLNHLDKIGLKVVRVDKLINKEPYV